MSEEPQDAIGPPQFGSKITGIHRILCLFAHLKYLRLDVEPSPKKTQYFNIEALNELTNLEALYLNSVWMAREQVLKLPKLKLLFIRIRTIKKVTAARLVIDSKLEKLICGTLNLIELKYPECIEFLDGDIWKTEDFLALQNLRVLHAFISEPILNYFQTLKHLEEIHLTWGRSKARNPGFAIMSSGLIDQLASKNSKLRKPVNVYFLNIFLGVHLANPFQTLFPYLVKNSFKSVQMPHQLYAVRIQHYLRLSDPVTELAAVDYHRLIGYLDNEMPNFRRNEVRLNDWQFPRDFFLKFQGIRELEVTEVLTNEERFLFFLGQCSELVSLKFVSINQSVLNQLLVVCRSLTNLILWGRGIDLTQLDLSPIYRLKQLI